MEKKKRGAEKDARGGEVSFGFLNI